MNMQSLKEQIPASAKDIKLNLSSILSEEGAPDLALSEIYSIALASAYATKNREVIAATLSEAAAILSAEQIEAAKAAASIMAMNNIYYRFVHLVSDKSYASMPAKLRMNIIGNPGVDKKEFELSCLAVSAINGCGMCIDAHAKTLEQAGASKLAIQSAVRIAAVLNAAAASLETL
ncbi:MAG: ahpD [Gammaproteobacteria bacterium]|jgi:alkyl hydroperoxide reductase subunit D|nr:ahpD [Gammaproteobacteria bacterium]